MEKVHPFAELGRRISRARGRTGLSQERFAPIVGITRRHLIRLENGEHQASLRIAQSIATATGAAASEFRIVDEEETTPDPFRGSGGGSSPRDSGSDPRGAEGAEVAAA